MQRRFDERHAWKRVTHINYLLTNLPTKTNKKRRYNGIYADTKTLGAIKRGEKPQQSNEESLSQA
jgi:hypothetical protein